jgi:hypothetical protein
MEHVVFYQSSQGTPAFRRVSSLEDAVTFAEHLRNVEGVTDFSVYTLSPVTLSLRAYYHVEVSGDAAPSTPTAAAPAAPTAPAPAAPPTEPTAAEPTTPAPITPQADEPVAAPIAAPAPDSVAAFDRYAVPDEHPTAPIPSPAPQAAAADGPLTGSPLPEAEPEPTMIDPSVVDPTVEEVVPMGRRSMGFFARS